MGDDSSTAANPTISAEAGRVPSSYEAEVDDLRFEAIRNGRYHLARRSWYEWLHRIMMFIVVMAGATAVTKLSVSDTYLVLLATAAGILDLVFAFGEKAAQHARLQELSYEVLAAIEGEADDLRSACRRGRVALARVYASEPKTMRAVDALAYNDTKEGLEKDAGGDLIPLRWHQKMLTHIVAFDGAPMLQSRQLRDGKLPDCFVVRKLKEWFKGEG